MTASETNTCHETTDGCSSEQEKWVRPVSRLTEPEVNQAVQRGPIWSTNIPGHAQNASVVNLLWLQVERSTFEKSQELARLTGLTQQFALGAILNLWNYATSLADMRKAHPGVFKVTDVDGFLATATGINRDQLSLMSDTTPTLFATALEEVGLIEIRETTLRIRGLSRYFEMEKKRAIREEKNAEKCRKYRESLKTEQKEEKPKKPKSDTKSDTSRNTKKTETRIEENRKEYIDTAFSFAATAAQEGNSSKSDVAQVVAHNPKAFESWQGSISEIETAFEVVRGQKFGWDGRAFKALKAIEKISEGNLQEVLRRWKLALQSTHPVVGELHEFLPRWNKFAGEPVPKVKKNFDIMGAENVSDPW